MPRARNLIIGCDGTWNDTAGIERTNVPKLLNACATRHQIVHYEEGVGTAYLEALPGGIYGKGLDRQILGAYRFLRKRLNESGWASAQQNIFIFGFSRGAYAARRLCGLINHSGIPYRARDVELGWQMYLNQDVYSASHLQTNGRFFSTTIKFLGVWDSVKSTIDPDYADLTLSPCVRKACHAMALDEQRKPFPVLRFNASQRVNQQWFSGVHSDVGGGYPEPDLSDITLKWMIDQSWAEGLRLKASAVRALKPNPAGVLHNSLTGPWQSLGRKIRRVRKEDVVHESVRARCVEVASYRPRNASQWLNEFSDLA
jgi:uncharacterized protein (DUF2235 family)